MLERVMIISGESSGELYGALLARELFSKRPDLKIIGVGGERMLKAGVTLISTVSGSFGLIETLKTLKKIRKTYKTVVESIKTFKPNIVVLIDFPDFNLKIAKIVKEIGIKVLYYVSPQIWAWRYSRIEKIKRYVDKMALILPFEEEIYRNANIPCEFVGHPVMDEIKRFLKSRGIFEISDLDRQIGEIKPYIKKEIGLYPDKPSIAIMLGSRLSEISRLTPVAEDLVVNINKTYPNYQVIIPVAPNLENRYVDKIMGTFERLGCNVLYNESVKSLIASDIAVIASGTSTLQSALLGVPMVVVYRLSPITYFIGRRVVKIKDISIVNLILENFNERELKVRELIQDDVTVENIMKEISLLNDPSYRAKIIKGLNIVRDSFLNKEATTRVGEIVEELSGDSYV